MPRPKKNKQAGEAFKKLLKEKGFTQYKLEQVTGLDKGLISKIATGQTAEPKPTTLEKIATALGVELGELTKIFVQPSMRSQPSQSAKESLPQQTDTAEETIGVDSDSVGVESAIAESASEDIEALVQKVRSHFDKTIRDECETLCMFNLLYTPMRGNLSRIYVQTKLNESQGFGSAEFSQKRQLWNEVVLRNPKLMVLGKPGAGKTTLLQYIPVHCDEINFQPKLVPVFVSLKTLAENARRVDELSLLGYIRKKYCRSNVSEHELETLLSHGRFLFLLDGLDEVTEDKLNAVRQEAQKLFDEYSNNRFIISCRQESHSYKTRKFDKFTICKVAKFEQEQIEEFIKNWFNEATANTQIKHSTQVDKLINKLKLPENQRIRELADTPLLLHLICLIFQERGDLPSKRFELYKEGIDLLLEKWNQFNERTQIDVSDIDLVDLRKALRQIASMSFKQGKYYFEEEDIIPFIKNCSSILSKIEVLSGILVKSTWKAYVFSHQTFQEYLTAEAFIFFQEGWQNLVKYITDERWSEVFTLISEMLPLSQNQNELLLLIKQKIDESLALENKLQQFLIWIREKSSLISVNYKSAAIRAFYLESHLRLDHTIYILNEVEEDDSLYNFYDIYDYNTEMPYLIDPQFNCKSDINLDTDYRLYVSLRIFWEQSSVDSLCSNDIFDICLLFDTVDKKLIFNLPLSIPEYYDFLRNIQNLKNQLPVHQENLDENIDNFEFWWLSNGLNWTKNLRDTIIKHRNLGHDWEFNSKEQHLLMHYYEANKLLIKCLKMASNLSPEVRALIEDNLFIPLDSSVT